MTMASIEVIRGEYWPDCGVQWHIGQLAALDLPYWEMRFAPYYLIHMAIEIGISGRTFVISEHWA